MSSRTSLLFMLAASLVACDDSPITDADAGPPVPDVLDLPSLEATNSVARDDPLFEGEQRFLWDAMGTERVSGLPLTAFFEAWLAEEPDLFDRYGFVDDPNDDLPIGLKRGLEDPSRVQTTCALCHVAALPDTRVWLGAPNTALAWGAFRLAVNARWVGQGNVTMLTPLAERKLADLGPGRTDAGSSTHAEVVPTDLPPAFRLGDRTSLGYLGTGGDVWTQVYLAVYALGAGNPNPTEALVPWPAASRLDPLIDSMGAFEAPSAPPADATLIEAGLVVYRRAGCDSCHHIADAGALGVTPQDEVERMPGDDPAFPIGSIATSRALLEASGGPDGGSPDLIAFISRHGLTTRISDGYRAADLTGVWATAPYLHNGSVPTLDALLRSAAERSATFDRDGFSVDTTVGGNGNEGHEFGAALSEVDRSALVVYLRTL